MAEFQPYLITEAGVKFYLPQRMQVFNFSFNFVKDVHETPPSNGVVTFGHALASIQVSIEGETYKDADTEYAAELESFDRAFALGAFLATVNADNKLSLVIYNDGVSVYRWFDNISVDSFNTDVGETEDLRPSYSLVLLIESPELLKTTAPDEA